MTDPCRWSSRSHLLLHVRPLPAPSPSCSSHHPWPEEHGSWAQLQQQRNVGIAECSRQAGNHEHIFVCAVLMTEWLSHADVVRLIDMLRVWMSVGGRAKMTYGDVCDVPRIMRTRRHRSVGTLKKCTARKLIVYSWCSKKVCLQAHQGFM